MLSTTRLYGAAIAVISGLYSLWLATAGTAMTASAWLMVVLGVIVLLHGVVLLTPAADQLGAASGPLMIAYAVVMLLNQGWMAAGMGGVGMDGGTGGMMDGGMMGGTMGTDAGMVAIATLMLASGIIMTVRDDGSSSM